MFRGDSVSENDGEDFFPITELPDEIVLKILRLLPAKVVLPKVCRLSRRFRRLGFNSIAQLDLDYWVWPSPSPFETSASLWKRIIERCPMVRTVRIDMCSWFPKDTNLGVHVLKSCPRMEELRWVDRADPTFYDVLKTHGRKLRRLGLLLRRREDCCLRPNAMRHLTHISIVVGLDYTPLFGRPDEELLRDILEIGKCCRGLESFTLSCSGIEPDDGWEEMKTFLQSIKGTVKELCFRERLMNDASYAILPTCQRLEKLVLYSAVDLTLFRLRRILQLPILMELCIAGSNAITSEAVYVVAFSERKWQRLKRLNLCTGHFLGDAALLAIAQGCPELVFLDVDFSGFDGFANCLPSKAVSSDGLRRSVLAHCGKLRDLSLVGAGNLTLDDFADVKERLPLLRSLLVLSAPLFIQRHYASTCEKEKFDDSEEHLPTMEEEEEEECKGREKMSAERGGRRRCTCSLM